MATVRERLPEDWVAAVRPALMLFVGALAGCIAWAYWYQFTGHNPPLGLAIGVSVGGLMLTSTRLWPLLALAVLVTYWLFQSAFPLVEQGFRAVGLALGALLTATLIQRRGIDANELLDPRSVLWIFIAAVAGSLVAAGIVALGGITAGHPFSFVDKFAQQGIGMILVAPLVLVWATPPRERWSPLRWIGFIAVMLFCGAIAAHAFLTTTGSPMSWAIFPPLVLAALGWHLRGATTSVAISAVIVLWSTEIDTGPFSTAEAVHRQLLAQIFVAVTCVTIFLLAAYADERHAEDKLSLAARRLEMARRNLTNMARDATSAVAILDRDLHFVAASKRFLTDFRLPEDVSVEGRSHFEVFPVCAPERRDQYARVLAGEALSGNADALRHPDGTVDYVRWSFRPWRDEDDQVAGVVITSEFVTAEMEDRRRLEEAERRYRAVFEQAGVGVGRLSTDGVFLEVNDRICELTGYPREALIGASCRMISSPEEWQSSLDGIQALASGEVPFYSDDRIIVLPDGSRRPVHCTANLVRSGDGTGDYLAIVILDISRRVDAQRAMEESEKLLRLAQEAAGVGVWEINLIRGGSRHSPQSARLFGLEWHEGEYRMADVADRLGVDQVIELRKAIVHARKTQGPLDMTLQLTMPDGESRWVTLQGRYDPHDGQPRLLGLVIDITRDMEADAQLREVHEKLLRLARLNAMGAMASTLAHELNQPLAAITNYLEACRYLTRSRGDPDHDILDALDRARVQALRAGDIIRKIRSFTVSGEITQVNLDLNAVIKSACTAVRQLKGSREAKIECEFDFLPANLIGDTLQIEQVLTNLIRNGVEATAGRERREVTVTTRIEPEEVVVSIADTGPGLSEAMLDNLFEPFRTTKESGTGLGLPICRTIVEAHGGRLWAENGPDGGAIFSFALPIVRAGETV
ncbi:PAS domain S-box-containing protein [Sphingomonas kyeonggiensis]|uniref:PAS domain S-box protein n=1 Tax=Sphingomonas kyeonggiensis TaxID=1268553 RepID=UPI00277F6434|nr:PAS domain S-box protein [Sphingomonas kyeonggiensis]MDQ0251141.1 PAS domain S-box-containing protein [Sphingomonas kyeonggiensis]